MVENSSLKSLDHKKTNIDYFICRDALRSSRDLIVEVIDGCSDIKDEGKNYLNRVIKRLDSMYAADLNTFVKNNISLAKHFSNKFSTSYPYLDRDEVESLTGVTLLTCAEKFDTEHDSRAQFHTFYAFAVQRKLRALLGDTITYKRRRNTSLDSELGEDFNLHRVLSNKSDNKSLIISSELRDSLEDLRRVNPESYSFVLEKFGLSRSSENIGISCGKWHGYVNLSLEKALAFLKARLTK